MGLREIDDRALSYAGNVTRLRGVFRLRGVGTTPGTGNERLRGCFNEGSWGGGECKDGMRNSKPSEMRL